MYLLNMFAKFHEKQTNHLRVLLKQTDNIYLDTDKVKKKNCEVEIQNSHHFFNLTYLYYFINNSYLIQSLHF